MKLADRLTSFDAIPRTSFKFSNQLSLLIVFWGIFLRVSQYVSNRSLWGDEVMLALNLVNRSYLELLKPLDYDQAGPPGFLWIEKTAILIFGNNEYALRLWPLLAGIIAIIAFYQLSKWAISPIAMPIALLLFACSRYTLYYATEVKQYSSDVMFALLLCLLLVPLYGKLLAKGRSFLLGVVGAIPMWFSHPAVFVLAGIELTNLLTLPVEKRKSLLMNRLPTYGLWLISFATLYFSITTHAMKNRFLQTAWGREYPGTIFDFVWLIDAYGRLFHHPLGFPGPLDGVAMVAFVIGCFAFFKLKRKRELLILMAPSFAALAAAYLHKYPFRARLILFLAPFFMLVIAEGAAYLLAQLNKRKAIGIFGLVLTGLLLVPPLNRASSFIISPETKEEGRAAYAYVKAHKQPGDLIYAGAYRHFKYYAPRFNFSQSDYIAGKEDIIEPHGNNFSPQIWQEFMQANNLKSGQRVWFVFVGSKTRPERQKAIEARLNSIGLELNRYQQPGADTYLYQLK